MNPDLWRRLADQAEALADSIGSNDPDLANKAYRLAGLLNQRWNTAKEVTK
ncbi:hypothetical protein I5I01_gp71 [Mycobacterium phage MooMoo]|uniref:Uncharacterized protein n=1 Tax=Mycobacterium phage MooMoo TaxID=2108127 RepID=A0A2P1JR92_9CAUD|nr:hypothetical protein I5I01_gp71 [Mycobacterium phage MooMoo]AVO21676.1 hypothetical protein SEA_MOOMOO_71 [Mycobacterium phage MooMoo]